MFCIMLCRICSCGSVVRVLHLISERLPVLIQAVCFAQAAYARQPFLNLRKPNPLLPVVVVACLRETTPTFNMQPGLGLQCTKVERSSRRLDERSFANLQSLQPGHRLGSHLIII